MSYKGIYKIKNPSKYKGDHRNCVFRSLWERKFMKYCDTNDNVVSWSSEEIRVPYRSPLDGKIHQYFVDFWLKTKKTDKTHEEFLIEIKPHRQTKPPVVEEEKLTKAKINQIKTYAVNLEKWRSAKRFCENRGWKFLILTEKDLFGRKNEQRN